jgi:hypothetical protein
MNTNHVNHPGTVARKMKIETVARVPIYDREPVTGRTRPASRLVNDLWSKLDSTPSAAPAKCGSRPR